MRKSRLMPALDLRDVPGGADEPVQIYPEDDARSLLPPHVGGYGDDFGGPIEGDAPDDEVKAKALDALKLGLGTAALDAKTGTRHMPGLDLRDPTVDATMGEPTILSRTPASAPPLRAALRRLQAAPSDGEIPAGLEGAIAGIGGVADRAQAAMDGPGQVPPGSLKGRMAQVVMGGARKPLAPASPDPRMEAVKQYVSEKRAPRDDVAAAEDKSNLANLNANLGEAGATIGAALGGGRPDTSFYDRLRQGAGAPVASAEKRAAVVRQALLDKRKGDAEFAQDSTRNELDRERLRIEDAKAKAAGQSKPRDPLADAKTQAEIDEIKARTEHLGRKGRGGGGAAAAGAGGDKPKPGAQIPASEAAGVGELDAANKTLDELEQNWQAEANQSLVPDGLAQYFGGTKASRYADETMTGAAQTIGTILEGGKLTDADLPKYMKLLPTAGDSEDRAKSKIAKLRTMIADKKAAKIAGLKAAGFNASGFEAPSATAQPSERDSRAVAWAKANPNDPRAAKILEINKVH